MTSEQTMTAEDAAFLAGADSGRVPLDNLIRRRILATYRALTEKTAECEKLYETNTRFADSCESFRAQIAELNARIGTPNNG